MKAQHVLLGAVLASATLFAQTSPSQGGRTSPNPQHHPSTASPTQPGTQQTGGMQMGNRMGGDMAAMQAEMQQMRTKVEQMRADAQKVQDTNTRTVLIQNAAIWEQFLDHMQSHMQNMGQGMMGMHGMMGPGTGKRQGQAPDKSQTPQHPPE